MALIDTHEPGTPNWVDTSVSTTEQREGLMAFYTALFGWNWEVMAPEMGSYSMATHDGRHVMGVGQGDGGAGQLVVYFSTTDIAAVIAHSESLGAKTVMGPMEIGTSGTMALVLDPTGAVFGFWQPNEFAGFEVVHEPNAPGWYNHQSADPAAAATFYSAVLGQPIQKPGPDMLVLGPDDGWFASLSPDEGGAGPSWNPIYVADSLARIRAAVTKAGGTVILEAMDVPGTQITVFTEPVMGTTLSVMEHRPPS